MAVNGTGSPQDFGGAATAQNFYGVANGTISNTENNSSSPTHSSELQTISMSFSGEQQVDGFHETITITRRKFLTDFENVDESFIDDLTIESLLEYIERQRLTFMPPRGSHWDKVLKWAEFFALQISGYATVVEPFMPESKAAAQLIWTASRSLVHLGPDNARALEMTFGIFYRLGLSISSLLRESTLLVANRKIRSEVGQAFNNLLLLVREVSLYYSARLHSSAHDISFDFNGLFGGQIAAFHQRRNHIIDAMWEHSLGNEAVVEVRALRKWLGPNDSNLQRLLKVDETAPGDRSEYTCEWFQSHLLSYTRSKKDVLAVHGPAGCGKSVLGSWILERLQRPIGRKAYLVLACAVEADIPGEGTSLAVVKRLLQQLLEVDIGHKKLHRDLVKIYHGSAKATSSSGLEEDLWRCLESGLARTQDISDTMIVLDGLDFIRGGEKVATMVSNRLTSIAAKHSKVQIIILSRSAPSKPSKGETQSFAITADHTHEDLRTVIYQSLENYKNFRGRSEHAQEDLVEQILHSAKGNFLWALLTTAILKHETSEDGFNKAARASKEVAISVDETIAKLASMVDLSKPETGLLISLMLAADRPLSAVEMRHLLQIDLSKKQSVERRTDLIHDIEALGPLVVLRSGFVRFFHPVVISYMVKLQEEGKKLRSSLTAQTELLKRLLAYCNFSLPKTGDVTFDLITRAEVEKLFSTHALLEYAVRNWIYHFRSSTYHHNEAVSFDDHLKAIFPSTPQLSVLEWACWNYETSRADAVSEMDLAFHVRKRLFSEQHVSVFQSLVVCGSIWREITRTSEAADCFYRASIIGQQVLNKFHQATAACATTFLSITEAVSFSSRTELVTRREKMLIYIVDLYKYQHGKNHDLVIRHHKMLAQLYVSIHEEHRAESIWRELREIVIVRFGKGSAEETSISENLTVILKKGDKKTDVVEYERGIFDIITELDVWNIRRIQMTIELAMSYEARGEFLLAEELFVYLWKRLMEECHHSHHHHGVEIHIHILDVVIEYARFLRRCHRHEEASSVLICLWSEYEEYDFESELLFLRLKVIGELMRAVSLLSVAVTVFKKCMSWFKSRSLHEHTSSCEILISETLKEISTVTTTTTTSTATTTEIIVKEAFELTLSRSSISIETINACKTLISRYMSLEQWSAAIEVTRRSLMVIWKSVIAGSGTIALPRDFTAGAIDIAVSLAICHHRSLHYYEAEEIYVRIYRACRNSCRIDDERLIKAYEILIQFYEESRHWPQVIEIYKELLVEFRARLGAKHQMTIQTLYHLGSLCAEHGYEAHHYYEEIIKVNHDGSICHPEALDAMIYMCRYHWEAGRWDQLQTVCKILWETWTGQHSGCDRFTIDIVETLYFRYRYVLEQHVHCEFSILHQLTIAYRNTCIKIFGAAAAITIKATIELAQICMRSEKHFHEAISIYEEVLTQTNFRTTKTVVSTTTITTVKQRLAEAYTTVCSHESVSSTTIERAIKILIERYEYLKLTYGWTQETLLCLREVVLLHLKLEKHEVVTRILLEATIQIVLKEKHSQSLHECGRTLGQIFMTCGMTSIALEAIHEFRLQIITGHASEHNKRGLKIDKSVGRICFVFLVTLEQAVRGALSVSYSQVMADYLTESVLYESYRRSLSASAVIIVGHAARLRAFLLSHERYGQMEILEKESYDVFVKKWAINARSREIGLLFYISLLVQIGDMIRDVQIGHVACLASVTQVRTLLESGQVQKAYEVAECAYEFIEHQRSYHHLQNVPAGFKLSALLACRSVDPSIVSHIDHKLREHMLELSRKITRGVLKACRDSEIDFVRLQLKELNDLVGLLGDQQNYADNEWILELLWKSREVHKTWAPSTIIAIGRRFVEARYLNASKELRSEAIRLCKDIYYNMRRTWGSLDPKTLEISNLLSSLYTNMGHYREAQDLHENILRLVVEGDDGDDRTLDTMDSKTALHQVALLKQSFLRLHGWDKSPQIYVDLIKGLKEMPEYSREKQWKQLSLPSEWNAKETPSDTLGKFFAPQQWEFVLPENVTDDGKGIKEFPSLQPGRGMKRATSNWGIGLLHRFMHGDHGHGQSNGTSNGNGRIAGRKTMAVDDEEGYESAEEVINMHEKPGKVEIVH